MKPPPPALPCHDCSIPGRVTRRFVGGPHSLAPCPCNNYCLPSPYPSGPDSPPRGARTLPTASFPASPPPPPCNPLLSALHLHLQRRCKCPCTPSPGRKEKFWPRPAPRQPQNRAFGRQSKAKVPFTSCTKVAPKLHQTCPKLHQSCPKVAPDLRPCPLPTDH
jgi:hypothetical protein